jgi:serine/threonine-protein kinase
VTPIFRRRRDADVADTAVVEEPVTTEEVVEEEIPPPPPPRIWPWLLALLLLVLAGGIAWWLLTREDEKTTMPNVIGLTESQARARLAESELEADVDRRLSRRERGRVFAQIPGAGTQLNEGQRVEILVSSGLVRVLVPEVVGEREGVAVRALRSAGFDVDVQRFFAGAPRGEVVEQDPAGGARAERGSRVIVRVSRGRNLAPVPDVLGLPEEQAVQRLRAAGFTPRVFDVPSPDPRGTVVAQEPRGGVQAPPDARVRINVSTGEQSGETTERPAGTNATVPNVVGLAQTPALQRLFDAGFDGLVRFQRSEQPLGRVIAQRPAGETSAPERSQVVVTVSSGRTPQNADVPDVTGQDEATARDTLEAAGFRVDTIDDTTSDADPGTVLDQQPPPGASAPRGATITLWIAAEG